MLGMDANTILAGIAAVCSFLSVGGVFYISYYTNKAKNKAKIEDLAAMTNEEKRIELKKSIEHEVFLEEKKQLIKTYGNIGLAVDKIRELKIPDYKSVEIIRNQTINCVVYIDNVFTDIDTVQLYLEDGILVEQLKEVRHLIFVFHVDVNCLINKAVLEFIRMDRTDWRETFEHERIFCELQEQLSNTKSDYFEKLGREKSKLRDLIKEHLKSKYEIDLTSKS